MPSHNKTGRKKRNSKERFVKLQHWLLNSAAWLSLTTQARAVYVELARRYNGVNNGEIALSQRDAARRCRIATDTAARAFGELIDKGFIAIVTPGSYAYKLRHATEYRLTVYECFGKEATKDFMRWKPENTEPGPSSGTKCPRTRTETSNKRPNSG